MLTPPGPDEQADDDEHDAPQKLAAHDREDAGDDQDDGEDPQEGCHGTGSSPSVLCGIGPFG